MGGVASYYHGSFNGKTFELFAVNNSNQEFIDAKMKSEFITTAPLLIY